jgi:alanine dehydrogenase
MKTLLLSESAVKEVLSMEDVIPAVESAFRMKGVGNAQMPPKQYLFIKKHTGDLRTMPSYLEDIDVVAVKIVNVHPNNRIKHNLPTVMATIQLIDPTTGAPLAIMGGTWITDLRTGAAGAIATKYLANDDPQIIGLVGAGAQAKTQLMGLLQLHQKIEEIRVWSRTTTSARSYANDVESLHSRVPRIVPVTSIQNAVQGADIVVTTTPSRTPLVSEDWIDDGTHINCIGADAPGKQELDPAILTRAKIVVDCAEQGCHSGEINVPLAQGIITEEDIWGDICEIVAGLKPGRTSTDEITVFTSTGLAIQDAASAHIAYTRALERNLGEFVEIINV